MSITLQQRPTGSPPLPNLPVQQPTRSSPFGGSAPALRVAVAYLVAAVVWVAAGDLLPGGRWFSVHLFTLGGLTNLILVFTEHFGRTLTRAADEAITWQLPTLNLGVLLVLAGLPSGRERAVAVGATIVTTVVLAAYVRLRRLRKAAVGARFGWIVRTYERAHGAFIHGAILGALLGIGLLPGAWHGAARLAHLHANILGWAGLTLLATLVFFGPTITRTRIVPGADERAARVLRWAAVGLSVAVFALLGTGFGGELAVVFRLVAAAGLAVYAYGASVTCIAVGTAVLRAKPTATQPSVAAVCVWFPLVAWAEVGVVATGSWHLLDAVGVAMVVGILVPIITATLTYLTPLLRGPTAPVRAVITDQLARGAEVRAIIANTAAVTLVVCAGFGTALGVGGAWMARGAWVAMALVIVPPLLFAIAPPREGVLSEA